jgi:thiol-disulfide isomerase/thioredoxin
VVAVVLVALGVALVAGGGDDDTTDTARSDTTADPDAGADTDADAGAGSTIPGDDAPVTVDGTALPPLPDGGTDPAVGTPMPVLSGTGLDGAPVTIPAGGRPTLVLFVAHWCPHCQTEVPVVQQWVDDGGLPAGVDLVTVSTSADPRRPNHPPGEWLASEGWTAPVLVDGDDSAADAAGLTAFPFFVGVDAAGNVVGRTSGQLSPDQLSAAVADLGAAPS